MRFDAADGKPAGLGVADAVEESAGEPVAK
jgi:hypothetical protein